MMLSHIDTPGAWSCFPRLAVLEGGWWSSRDSFGKGE